MIRHFFKQEKAVKDDLEDFSDKENLKDEDIALMEKIFRKFLLNKKAKGKQKQGKKFLTKKKK